LRLLLAAVAITAALAVAAPVNAQPAFDVVAEGLDNPRGLGFGQDGHLYVAEAGRGGPRTTTPNNCFVGPEGPSCFGLSGAVTRIRLDGRNAGQDRVLTNLPSFAVENVGAAAIGPMDVTFAGSNGRYVTFGLGMDPALRLPQMANMGRLVRAQFMQNSWQTVADIAAFETANDPNADGPDTNPTSVIPDGSRLVLTDAGGNALLSVDPRRTDRVSTIAVFPNRLVPGPGGQPFSMDEVPTSVAKGRDGAYYVSQLTGFPFPVGGANVYRVEPGEAPEVYATGFTNIIDIGFGRDGELYVLEIFTNGLLSGDPTGALKRVNPDGSVDLISDDLNTPGGLVVKGRNVYVSDCGTCAGVGRVLRFDVG
jgi:hypothetical protein